MINRMLTTVALSCLAVALASPATAQTDPAPVTPPIADPAAEPQTSEGGGELGDIVVTAQRRSERLQDIPSAIAAVDGAQLEAAGIVNTKDLQLVVPSLVYTQTVFSPSPAIRGIGTRGTNPGDEQVVPVYLDGVYQPFITGAIFELSEVERIEVLKGPQGTLLGRNATGGAINIITADPQVEPAAKLKLGYGSFDEKRASLYVTGGTGPIAASLETQIIADDGYVRDVTNGTRLAALDSRLVRGKIRFRPGEDTDIILAASFADRSDTTALGSYPYRGNTAARRTNPNLFIATGNRESSQTPGLNPFFRIEQTAVSLTVRQGFDFADLTAISGYSDNLLDYLIDADVTIAPLTRQRVVVPDKSFSQELYLASNNDGRFSWIVGGFFFHDTAGFDVREINASRFRSETKTESYALYAQGSYKLTDQLTATIGGRYSIDNKSYEASGTTPAGSVALTDRTFRSFNPSVTIDYKVDAATLIYAKYATAYKSGLYNSSVFSATPVRPEQVKSYELGFKADLASWLRLNMAGYYTDYDDIQVLTRAPDSPASLLENAASAKIYGIEGDLTVRVTPRLNLRGGISVLHSEYIGYTQASSFQPLPTGGNQLVTIDASGNRLIRVPDLTGSGSIDYTVPVSFGSITASANAAYTGDFFYTPDTRLRQRPYVIANAQIGWRSSDDRYAVTLWARNLTNAEPPLSVNPSSLGDSAAYTRPRTVGVRFEAGF